MGSARPPPFWGLPVSHDPESDPLAVLGWLAVAAVALELAAATVAAVILSAVGK